MKSVVIRILAAMLSLAGVVVLVSRLIQLVHGDAQASALEYAVLAGAACGTWMFGRFALNGERDPLMRRLSARKPGQPDSR